MWEQGLDWFASRKSSVARARDYLRRCTVLAGYSSSLCALGGAASRGLSILLQVGSLVLLRRDIRIFPPPTIGLLYTLHWIIRIKYSECSRQCLPGEKLSSSECD